MDRVAFELLGREVHWYGIIIVVSILAGTGVTIFNATKLNYRSDLILDIALSVIPLAVIMARVFYVIFTLEYYKDNLIDVFKIWEGGLSIHGAVAGGVLAGWIFCRVKKYKFWDLADLAAPGIVLGQAIGRWGNFMNQEAYGLPITSQNWQWFPAAVFIDATNQWHMATFFYESTWNFVVFVILMLQLNRRKKEGNIFLLYIILYSIARFFIESYRMDSLFLGPFRVAQIFSIALILYGIAMLWLKKSDFGKASCTK